MKPDYNVAPGSDILTVRKDSNDTTVSVEQMRWGLVPEWAQDPAIGHRMINARSESVDQKPAFRSAFKHRRCLIPADGFYEWQGKGKMKQAYYFHLKENHPFAFAGLWERWQKDDISILSCTVLTTKANALMASIHDRMPVILPEAAYHTWLDETSSPSTLKALLAPYPDEHLEAEKVCDFVNSTKNNGPQCLHAPETKPTQGDLFN